MCCGFLTSLGEEHTAPLNHLITLIDDSRYDQKQWFAAIAFFAQWMLDEGRSGPVAHQLDYIRGCTAGPQADLGWLLVDVLADNLDEFGYMGIEPND